AVNVTDVYVDKGDPILTGVDQPAQPAIPTEYAVTQNYPNPFNPSTTINYQLPENAQVRLTVFNLLGQEVRTLVDRKLLAGYHQIVWDAKDNAGRSVGSGIYMYVLEAGDFTQTQKMVLLK
ncbi:MAG: T9SS type A sorting domain-containing protein, partial [Anaerolineae bacterium]|nr:T9SS type A sorting domain-containing protein [Anaerolineae bacterium]